MPVQGWGHSQYWTTTDTSVIPVLPTSGAPGYPLWQGGVIVSSFFGALAGLGAMWLDRLRIMWRLSKRVLGMSPEQRAVVMLCVETVDGQPYQVARLAVRRTSTTLGFNRPESWADLKAELKRDAGNCENTFRHLHTVNTLRQNLLGSTLSNPQAHLVVELAYQGFALKVK
jgi:hypothetical protein